MTRPAKAPAKRRGRGPSRHGAHNGVPILLRARDAAELERWTAAAARVGMTRTEWLRAAASAAVTRKVRP